MILGVIESFAAAHRLPWHKGQCANLHGHTYKVEVQIEGLTKSPDEVEGEEALLLDFSTFKLIVRTVVRDLDHQYLNDVMPNPTTENLAQYLHLKISEELSRCVMREGDLVPRIWVRTVKLWESESSYAIVGS